jgi:hypothetical protein
MLMKLAFSVFEIIKKNQMRSTSASALEKLKQFSIILTEPFSLNSVSNSTNKLYFHYQKANSFLNYKSCQNAKKDS